MNICEPFAFMGEEILIPRGIARGYGRYFVRFRVTWIFHFFGGQRQATSLRWGCAM